MDFEHKTQRNKDVSTSIHQDQTTSHSNEMKLDPISEEKSMVDEETKVNVQVSLKKDSGSSLYFHSNKGAFGSHI